ncbi:MAG: type IV secretion system DNA-binding domain-containing protein [Candidatus Dadabacteria bacterium]|nr:type IV secretion system DNA-binding domain-containing protein [Candidatus Dadabacteria bacterium]
MTSEKEIDVAGNKLVKKDVLPVRKEEESYTPKRRFEIKTVSQSKELKLEAEMARGMGGHIVFNDFVSLEPPFANYTYGELTPADLYLMGIEKPFEPSPLHRWLNRNTQYANPFTPDYYIPEGEERYIRIFRSKDEDVNPGISIQFLLSLREVFHPTSFEIVGTHEKISTQFYCRSPHFKHLMGQLLTHFPHTEFVESSDLLSEILPQYTHATEENTNGCIIREYVFSNTHFCTLKVLSSFNIDPLGVVMGAFEELGEDEFGVLQVILVPVKHNWALNILTAARDEFNPSLPSIAEPNILEMAKQKTKSPLFAVCLNVIASHEHIAQRLEGFLNQFSTTFQKFERFPGDGLYAPDELLDCVCRRASFRFGMLLNAEELASLVHLPSPSVHSEKLDEARTRTKACPDIALDHKLILGENIHRGEKKIVTLNPEYRTKHMYVLGASGTGKTNLILNMIVQDIHNGEGLAVLDPHGDLIDQQILPRIPEERFHDVVLFDPSDEEYPIGFNILYAHSEQEKTLMASDLISVFRRFSTNWGDQMNSVLANAILAFLESPKGGTLRDLRRFLVDEDFREEHLDTVTDEDIVFYWRREFPLLPGRPEGSVLTRLDTFLRPKIIRNIVSQRVNRLDFRKIMDEGKILLCKLSHGGIGEENAYTLGALLVSKLQQTVMTRQEMEEKERRNFYLYIDEFQNFITKSMESILSGARKYRLGLILAHQELMQIWGKDREVASSVISNPFTRVCFRLGDFDARKLSEGFSSFDAKDLQNLSIGEAVVRIDRAEFDFNLSTFPPPEMPSEDIATKRKETIRQMSRSTYATTRESIERELKEQRQKEEHIPKDIEDFYEKE